MKRLTLHRLASALLCLTLALSLTACGGKKKPAPAAGNSGVKETISDSRTDQTGQADPVKPSEPEAEVDPELVESCVYQISAVKARCNYLIRAIKERSAPAEAALAERKEDAVWT